MYAKMQISRSVLSHCDYFNITCVQKYCPSHPTSQVEENNNPYPDLKSKIILCTY